MESSTKDIEVDIGASFDLECKAQGYPKPNISWIRADGKALFDGTAKHNVILQIHFIPFQVFSFYFYSIII